MDIEEIAKIQRTKIEVKREVALEHIIHGAIILLICIFVARLINFSTISLLELIAPSLVAVSLSIMNNCEDECDIKDQIAFTFASLGLTIGIIGTLTYLSFLSSFCSIAIFLYGLHKIVNIYYTDYHKPFMRNKGLCFIFIGGIIWIIKNIQLP